MRSRFDRNKRNNTMGANRLLNTCLASAALIALAGCTGTTGGSSASKKAMAKGEYSPAVMHGKSLCLILDDVFNNDGIASPDNTKDMNFDLPGKPNGDGYSWIQLPDGGKPYRPNLLGGVHFIFPDYSEGKKNNVACNGQSFTIKPDQYSAIYVLGSSEGASHEDKITLITPEGEFQADFKLTDWCQPAQYGEVRVIEWDHRYLETGERQYKQCAIFAQKVLIPKGATLTGLRLPKNKRMHIFALSVHK